MVEIDKSRLRTDLPQVEFNHIDKSMLIQRAIGIQRLKMKQIIIIVKTQNLASFLTSWEMAESCKHGLLTVERGTWAVAGTSKDTGTLN